MKQNKETIDNKHCIAIYGVWYAPIPLRSPCFEVGFYFESIRLLLGQCENLLDKLAVHARNPYHP